MTRSRCSVRLMLVAMALIPLLVMAPACGKKSSSKKSTKTGKVSDPGKDVTLNAGTSSLAIPADSVDMGTLVKLTTITTPAAISALAATMPTGSIAVEFTATKSGTTVGTTANPMTLTLAITGAHLTVDNIKDNLCALAVPSADTAKLFVWRHDQLTIDGDKAKVTTRYFGTYQFAYCGTEAITGSIEQAKFADSYAVANGTWLAACASGVPRVPGPVAGTIQYVIKGASMVVTIKDFTTADCSGEAYTTNEKTADLIIEGDATAPVGAKKIRYRMTSNMMSIGQTLVQSYNQNSACGKTDWAANTPVETINNTNCAGFQENTDAIWWYDFAQVTGSDLQFGFYPTDDPSGRLPELGNRKYAKQ